MVETVTVFLIDEELGIPRDVGALPHVAIPTSLDSTIGEVAAKAAEELGKDGTIAFLSEARNGSPQFTVAAPTAVVENDGGLKWVAYLPASITLEELKRTKEAGLFEGDPLAIALDRRPTGNGAPGTWHELQQWMESFGGIATTVLAIRGLVAILLGDLRRILGVFQFLSRRFAARRNAKWLHEFLDSHRDRWVDAGANSPSPMLHFVLSRREWSAEQLAAYLRIEIAEARRFLEVVGYSLSPWSGKHVIAQNPRGLRLREDLVHALMGGMDPLDFAPQSDEDFDPEEWDGK